MKEIVRIGMDIKTCESEKDVDLVFGISLFKPIQDLLNKDERDKIEDMLNQICHTISDALKRYADNEEANKEEEELQKIKDDVNKLQEKVKECKTLEELFDLMLEEIKSI
jgi:flagellar motility protein MotE (MotC chaperone)